MIMKKLILAFVAMAVSVGAVAQVKARWGSIDVRYPVDCETPASDEAVNRAVAWRGVLDASCRHVAGFRFCPLRRH